MKAAQVKGDLVWDWMRPKVVTVQAEVSLGEAVERMNRLSIHHLIVMDGKNYKGILDARDCAGVWDKNKKVSQVMRSDVPALDENTEIRQVV
ncbi:MAG: CBS domain-containing protein, partial [Deltaproteobacteria bacterium]|nr:CBS domain-containing protein [Deltaproteobacteria bacterium]